ncbi:hypothetical protein GCM10020000_49480 [Streptomyces olivoverticillatus]
MQGEFTGGTGRRGDVRFAFAEQDDAGVQGLGLLDAVAEEVLGVGARGEVAGQQGAVGGERLGQLGGERRAADQGGEDGREAAARGGGEFALGPDEREGVRELGGQGLGRVVVGGDGGTATLGDRIEAVGERFQRGGRRAEQADPVGEGEQRGDQRPEGAGAGGQDAVGVLAGGFTGAHRGLVRHGGQRDRQTAYLGGGLGEGLPAGETETTEQPRR